MRTMLLVALTCAGLATGVQAGPIVDAATKAETALGAGDSLAALEALDQAMETLWAKSPLVFRKALLVDSAEGYGVYVARDNAVYKPDEPIHVYVEPIGYAYGKNKIGNPEINLALDFQLRDDTGKIGFEQADFSNWVFPVRYHNRELILTMNLNLTGLPVGAYVGVFTIRDRHSDKTGRFEIPFEVRD